MPRPTKCRNVCHYPAAPLFLPAEGGEKPPVVLTVDEYECVRLIDREGFSQEQCGEAMAIARTTVQLIYGRAREKLATMLVEGRPLRIEGGEFRLCDGAQRCAFASCYKRDYCRKYRKTKGEHTMRIAVTYENGQIFQHFGHTAQFKVYEVEDGEVVRSEVVDTNGQGHGALAGVLSALGAEVLLCGGIGGGAQAALAAAGIRLFGGVQGEADAAVEQFLSGKLAYNPNVMCSHHGEGHHHTCGDHGCGSEHHCH